MPTAYTADGKLLLYDERHPEKGFDLWALPLDGDRRPQPLLRTEFNESQAQLSPDGKFIAYISDESSRYEVYVATFPDMANRWQVSRNGGQQPRWRGDGKELFYVAPEGDLMAVGVDARGLEDHKTPPRRLFRNAALQGAIRSIIMTSVEMVDAFSWRYPTEHYEVIP